MDVKTKGIVLGRVKLSETKQIVTIYTEEYGRQSFVIRHSAKRQRTLHRLYFQPLNILEINFDKNDKYELHFIKEANPIAHFTGIANDPIKNSIALFISELLYHILQTNEKDIDLYLFLEQSIYQLDNSKAETENFHLFFMANLCRFMGFSPLCPTNIQYQYFDLINGVFDEVTPTHHHYLDRSDTEIFHSLFYSKTLAEGTNSIKSKKTRNTLLDNILIFYKLQLPDFKTLHSLPVLKAIWE